MRETNVGLGAESEFTVASETPGPGLPLLVGCAEEGSREQKCGGECESSGDFSAIHIVKIYLIVVALA